MIRTLLDLARTGVLCTVHVGDVSVINGTVVEVLPAGSARTREGYAVGFDEPAAVLLMRQKRYVVPVSKISVLETSAGEA